MEENFLYLNHKAQQGDKTIQEAVFLGAACRHNGIPTKTGVELK